MWRNVKCILHVHFLYMYILARLVRMPPFFDPFRFSTEFIYSLLVIVLCITVYVRTRELFELTKYGGIRYFRNAFLFFALAYASRFVFHLYQLGAFALDVPRHFVFPLMFPFVGYFSTIALFFLAYSMVWKNIRYAHFLIVANIIAVLVAVISHLSRSPLLISLVQLPLIVFTLASSLREGKRHTRALYFLISLFWLINLFALSPGRFLPLEIKIVLQIVSLVVFTFLLYKVAKWTK